MPPRKEVTRRGLADVTRTKCRLQRRHCRARNRALQREAIDAVRGALGIYRTADNARGERLTTQGGERRGPSRLLLEVARNAATIRAPGNVRAAEFDAGCAVATVDHRLL
jgi:hypothetical protein